MEDDEAIDDELPRPLPPLAWRDVLDRVLPPDRLRVARVVAGLAAAAIAAVGVWWAVRPPPAPAAELSIPFASTTDGAGAGASTTAPEEVVVHAAGAVVAPGLYRMPTGARVADLLAAAGGATADADLDRVNLAGALVDGGRVWFARVGEAEPGVAGGADAPTGADAGPLDLNRATAAELEALPGIGPSIASAIVEHRERNGSFGSVDELLEVAGIGPARLEELRPMVTV